MTRCPGRCVAGIIGAHALGDHDHQRDRDEHQGEHRQHRPQRVAPACPGRVGEVSRDRAGHGRGLGRQHPGRHAGQQLGVVVLDGWSDRGRGRGGVAPRGGERGAVGGPVLGPLRERAADAGGPVGRKLDFLSQEFNRESNTLCSKSNAASMTGIGLELKAVVDQFREQVQNL